MNFSSSLCVSNNVLQYGDVVRGATGFRTIFPMHKFHNYTLTTARIFVELYPWYYMPTSVHKLLIHSSQIVAHALLPIVQLSEEVQEARNNDIKRYREDFSIKCSRVKTMGDVFKRLLVTSDSYIYSIRKLP